MQITVLESFVESSAYRVCRRHIDRAAALLHQTSVPEAVRNLRLRWATAHGDTDSLILTAEKEKKIEEAVDASTFYSLLDAGAVVVVKLIRWFDPELGEFVEAVFLLIRVCKVLLE